MLLRWCREAGSFWRPQCLLSRTVADRGWLTWQEKEEADAAAAAAMEQLDGRAAEVEGLKLQVAAADKAARAAQAASSKHRTSCAGLPPPFPRSKPPLLSPPASICGERTFGTEIYLVFELYVASLG